jgi:hypothetical protein
MSDAYSKVLMQRNLTSNITDDLIASYKVNVACGLAFFVGVLEILMVIFIKIIKTDKNLI